MNSLKLIVGMSLLVLLVNITLRYNQEQNYINSLCNVPVQMQIPPNKDDLEAAYLIDAIHAIKPQMSFDEAVYYSTTIVTASHVENVPINVLTAIVAKESMFNPSAISNKHAVGLAQVVPKVWDNNTPYNIYDREGNVLAGAYILSQYKDKCGSWSCAIKAYNVGITAHITGKFKKDQNKYSKEVGYYLASIDSIRRT